MPDWLQEIASTGAEIAPQMIALRLVVATFLGIVIGGIYHGSQRRMMSESFAFIVTIILLTILVAMTTLVIGNSVARAFSLVGALSIVRFRTVVDDTRDTAFVIFAVVVGMAVGAGIVEVYVIGVPIVAIVSMCLTVAGNGLQSPPSERRLELRVEGGTDADVLVADVFRQYLSFQRLTAVSTAKQGASLDLEFAVRLAQNDSALQFVKVLAQLDGVQGVELK